LNLLKGSHESLAVNGQYFLNKEKDNLALQARFDDLEIHLLQAILKDLITDVDGTLSGVAKISGTPKTAFVDGEGQLDNAQFKVQYLNTDDIVNGPIRIEDSKLVFNKLTLQDIQG